MADFDRLLAIMARLRADDGCPWDRAQTFATIAPFTIEEAYEVADAIDRQDWTHLKEELGDLLLQVVFHARIADENGLFSIDDVATAICEKLVRRHPHLFGNAPAPLTASEQTALWEQLKAEERAAKASEHAGGVSVLDDLPRALPALHRAAKLQSRAARIGFDWPSSVETLAKVDEELSELRLAIEDGEPAHRIMDEVGDLLFTAVNVARKLGVDPDGALRHANTKFEQRFRLLEELAAKSPEPCALGDLEALWDKAKEMGRRSS